jgi:hypothetical protein
MKYISTLGTPEEAKALLDLHLKDIIKNETTICYIKYIEKFLLVVKIIEPSSSKDLVNALKEYKPALEIIKLASLPEDKIYDRVVEEIHNEVDEVKLTLTDADWEVIKNIYIENLHKLYLIIVEAYLRSDSSQINRK